MNGPQARLRNEAPHDEPGIAAPDLGVGELPAGQPFGGHPCVFPRELDTQKVMAGSRSRPR